MNGERHREDGPASISAGEDGTEEWWLNGPAVIYPDETVEYWTHGNPHKINKTLRKLTSFLLGTT